jgi:hypothetical protein
MLIANSGPYHDIPEEMLMHHFVGGLKLESVAEEIVSIFC